MAYESYEHENMIAAPAADTEIRVEFRTEDGILRCYGTVAYTVLEAITDAFAPGCQYTRSLTAGSSVVYINVGTMAAPNFDAITVS